MNILQFKSDNVANIRITYNGPTGYGFMYSCEIMNDYGKTMNVNYFALEKGISEYDVLLSTLRQHLVAHRQESFATDEDKRISKELYRLFGERINLIDDQLLEV